MRIYHYIYVSKAAIPMSEEDLSNLSQKSAENNLQAGLTGMLMYAGGFFMQVLEGDKHFVEHVAGIINKDPRHTDIVPIASGYVSKRLFPNWSMGVINLDSNCRRNFMNDAKVLSEFLEMSKQACVSNTTVAALKYFRSRLDFECKSLDDESDAPLAA